MDDGNTTGILDAELDLDLLADLPLPAPPAKPETAAPDTANPAGFGGRPAPAAGPGSGAGPAGSKYFLFEWAELDQWQATFRERLDTAEGELRHPPEDIRGWREKKIAEWAQDISTKQHRETHHERWRHFPELIREFMWGVYGLEEFLADSDVSEIFLDGHNEIRTVRRDGTIRSHPSVTSNPDDFLALCRNWVAMFSENNERLDRSSPACNITLPNGDRMHIISFLGDQIGHVTIRRHDFGITNFDVIVENGTLSQKTANFLKAAVAGKANIIVGGSTGCGKTTLLRCMLSEVPAHKRVIIIEDTKEIGFKHANPDKWGVELRKRHANIEGEGEISMEQLIVESLRMNPDRVIVGEVRGSEVTPMLLSMSQGNDGSLATIHANSAGDVISRLHNFVTLYSGKEMSDAAVLRTIGQAVEMIVYMQKVDGTPKLTDIIAVEGAQTDADGRPTITEIVKWDAETKTAERKTPKLPHRLRAKLRAAGWAGWNDANPGGNGAALTL